MKKTIHFCLVILIGIAMIIINGCTKGKDGAPGNANVSSFTFSVSSWSSNSIRWYSDLSVPAITSANINSASVQVYFSTTGNSWTALPNTTVSSTNYFMGFSTSISTVQITWIYNGIGIGSDPNTVYSATLQFKVVVIPPAIKKSNPNVNWNNYGEVNETFNLRN